MTEKLIFSPNNKTGELRYNRSSSNIQYKLEQEISKIYNGSKVCVCNSGMNSIDGLLHSIFISNKWNPYNIILGDEIYTDTTRLFRHFQTDYGTIKEITELDVTYDDKIMTTISRYKNEPTIIFVESCSNPNGYIFNWGLIPEMRKINKNLIIIVDNTWLTGLIFNPLKVGADYVICSTTKYYSGSGCIGGFVVGNNMKGVSDWFRIHGVHVSPHNCKVTLDGLNTLKDRMCVKYTIGVAEFLEKHPKVIECNYPILKSHKSHYLALKYWNKDYIPSVLTFTLPNMKINQTRDWLKNHTKLINYKTSYGGEDNR
ncbi:unnamed protein product, partial [marine sediment metagenome]